MGARIEGAGHRRCACRALTDSDGATHTIIPDRIEAGTFLVAGAITGGDVEVTDCAPEHLDAR